MIVAKRSKGKRNRQGKPRVDKGRAAVANYAGDAYDLARRTWSGLNEIRKLINIEEKFIDYSANSTADYTGYVLPLSQIAQGVTVSTRVGNSIKVQRLTVRGRVSVATAVTTFSTVRILIIRDMEGQGSAPTTADIFESVGTAQAPLGPLDWLNRKRFGLLYDTMMVVSPAADVARLFELDVPLEKHVLYRGTTAGSASDGEGTIYLVAVSDEPTNLPAVRFTSRIVFTDD